MATNLDSELVRKLLALRQAGAGELSSGGDARTWAGTGDLAGYSVTDAPGEGQWIGGDAGYYQPGAMRTRIGGNFDNKTFGVEGHDVWNDAGQFVGRSTGDSDALSLAKMIALSVGGYYGAGAANGALGATSAAGGAGGGLSGAELAAGGMDLGGGMASGVSAWDAAAIKSALASGELGAAAGYGSQVLGAGNGMSTLGSMLGNGAGQAATTAATNALTGGGLSVGGLLGAAAGALDSRDKEQTTSRDPWSAAQPFLKQQLAQGQELANRYQAQPFSPAQQTAYGNVGAILDAINAGSPGLMAGMQANAGGANQFYRGRTAPLQGSNFSFNFAPGLLGNFGTRG